MPSHASRAQEPAAQAMSLPWLVRKAIKFANELQVSGESRLQSGASRRTSPVRD